MLILKNQTRRWPIYDANVVQKSPKINRSTSTPNLWDSCLWSMNACLLRRKLCSLMFFSEWSGCSPCVRETEVSLQMSYTVCDCCVDWMFVVHCEIILWHIKPEIIPFTGQSLVSISASAWGRCTVSVQMHHHVCHNPASARPALQMLRWKSHIWMSVDNIVTWSVKLNFWQDNSLGIGFMFPGHILPPKSKDS